MTADGVGLNLDLKGIGWVGAERNFSPHGLLVGSPEL